MDFGRAPCCGSVWCWPGARPFCLGVSALPCGGSGSEELMEAGGGQSEPTALSHLGCFKSREEQSVSQSVKTAQNESTCLRRGCGASEQTAVWIQFSPAAAAPPPAQRPSFSWFLAFVPLPSVCVHVRVLDVQDRTVMYNHMLTCVLERVQTRAWALASCSF